MSASPPSIGLFAYNFPHRKTQDFILRLLVDGHRIGAIIAADWVALNIPASTIRTKLRGGALIHPQRIADRFGIPYLAIPHDAPDLPDRVRELGLDLGLVAGARILKKPVIECFRAGILNLHPGLIPEARGLDALLWSIRGGIPLGVTAHLIDERVDAGAVLERRAIPLWKDDTLVDLSERIHATTLEMIAPGIRGAMAGTATPVSVSGPHNRKMPAEMEQEIPALLRQYLERMNART